MNCAGHIGRRVYYPMCGRADCDDSLDWDWECWVCSPPSEAARAELVLASAIMGLFQ